MSTAPPPLAILFADLGGSTRLYDTLGDVEARRITAECVDRIIAESTSHGGTVIKTIGDEVMCSFPDADGALDAAIAIVRQVSHGVAQGVGVHVGFHYGPVLRERGDLFGDTVNVAARMVGLARDSEILTTRAAVSALSADRRSLTRQIDRRALKGKEEKVEIYTVAAAQDGSMTTVNFAAFDEATLPDEIVLTLRLLGRELTLDSSRTTASIGRDSRNDLVLPDEQASRQHAVIELRHGKFYLCDRSTNGTVLCPDHAEPVFLRREEAILRGSGRLGLSQYPEHAPATPIDFEVKTPSGS